LRLVGSSGDVELRGLFLLHARTHFKQTINKKIAPVFEVVVVTRRGVTTLPDVSPMLFYLISSLRITPTTSSNFKVFEPETELLTAMTKPFQLFGNESKIRRSLTSSSKSTFTELS